MIDIPRRKKLAFHLRQLSTGIITNDEFESNLAEDITKGWLPDQYYRHKDVGNDDPAILPIAELAYGLYSDLEEHRLTEKYKLTDEGYTLIARCILFLRSEREYEWPKFDNRNPDVNISLIDLLLIMITLGFYTRYKRRKAEAAFEEFKRSGPYEVWPFFRHEDYDQQLLRPSYLTATQ